ncbi:isochorismatase [Helicobacter sp. 16-1353]|uniref:isochorismatase family protein n=1 Tax=Helicobacter sp. 16-1353 TaxID=2004996 RepID=UPI000DCF629A|nr:isochorismatase family protein [Helicobacter sp. 16-1353]RAX54509.1 isochorismatase [Helicobacter sp. 16-1353]
MTNILLIIDMQNGFMRNMDSKNLAIKIQNLLELRLFDSVVATRFLNAKNSIYERLLGWERLQKSEESSLFSGLTNYIDFTFDKYIYDCVNTSFLQKLCQINSGIAPQKVFIVGADTDCCVLVGAVRLFENNIRPIVLSKYCASNGGVESHKAGLLCLKRLIGDKQISDIEITKDTNLAEI